MNCSKVEWYSNECADNVPVCNGAYAYIDRCLLPELRDLWSIGINTISCCCGHGIKQAAFIVPADEESEKKMIALGYQIQEGHLCFTYDGRHTAYQPKTEFEYERI